MKRLIRRTISKLFPQAATQFFAARARAYSHNLVQELGCGALNRKLLERFGNRVLHGPCAGMVLSPATQREHLAPFLLGTYESELHPAWDLIFRMDFTLLIDVGAKFGFYAVGLARRFPQTKVIAFDADPWARDATGEMSVANHVTVELRSLCTPHWLRKHLPIGAFVLSDCEGYEAILFGADALPNLRAATMLIETHEEASPGVTENICNQFARSHQITIIPADPNYSHAVPELASLDEKERAMAVDEYRPAQQSWIFLLPAKVER